MDPTIATILIATVPSILTSLATGFVTYKSSKKKYSAEIDQLKNQSKSIELENMHKAFEILRFELKDISDRYAAYIESAGKRSEASRKQIELLETKVDKLEELVEELKINACFDKVCKTRVTVDMAKNAQ